MEIIFFKILIIKKFSLLKFIKTFAKHLKNIEIILYILNYFLGEKGINSRLEEIISIIVDRHSLIITVINALTLYSYSRLFDLEIKFYKYHISQRTHTVLLLGEAN